jgi:hypothetical protein
VKERILMSKELIGKITEVGTSHLVGNQSHLGGETDRKYPTKTLTYEIKGRKIICTIETDDIKVKASARCHEGDIFDLSDGCGIAEFRARQKFYKVLEEQFIESLTNPFAQMLKAMSQWNE